MLPFPREFKWILFQHGVHVLCVCVCIYVCAARSRKHACAKANNLNTPTHAQRGTHKMKQMCTGKRKLYRDRYYWKGIFISTCKCGAKSHTDFVWSLWFPQVTKMDVSFNGNWIFNLHERLAHFNDLKRKKILERWEN